MEKIISSIISRFFYKCFFSWSVFLFFTVSGTPCPAKPMQFLLIANKKRHGGRVICLRKDGASFPKENLWGKIARRVFLPAFQGSAFRLHCLRNGSAALPIGARFYLLYVLKTYSLLQTSISMLSVSDFSKQIIGSWFDYAHQPPDNDLVCAKNWGSYAKQPGIRFGRNGKKNLDENPFARSERSERKSYYRRTWLLQTTHWILQPDFSGSGAQN